MTPLTFLAFSYRNLGLQSGHTATIQPLQNEAHISQEASPWSN